MSTINDWLDHQQAAPAEGNGMTMMDMLELPPAIRTLLRLLLRKGPMSYHDLAAAAAAQPDVERLSDAQLAAVIETLSRQRWLQRVEGETARYRLHLRPKSPNTPSA